MTELSNNPMAQKFGQNKDKRCKTCAHLVQFNFGRKYYKCELRGISHSHATDHRVNWFACGKYKDKK